MAIFQTLEYCCEVIQFENILCAILKKYCFSEGTAIRLIFFIALKNEKK